MPQEVWGRMCIHMHAFIRVSVCRFIRAIALY